MQIDRPFLTAWIFGFLIHGSLVFVGYRVTPASGEITYEDLVPIEIVQIESTPVPDPVPESSRLELEPEPEPAPEPEPPADLADHSSPIPTDADENADPDSEPVFGLTEESVVEDTDGGELEEGTSAPIGNTVGVAPGEGGRPDTVRALAPVPYHQVTMPPELIKGAKAEYPPLLRNDGIEGQAIIEMIIEADGTIREAKVIRSSHDAFGAAALQAARKYRFKPAQQGDRPVPVRILMPFDFEVN